MNSLIVLPGSVAQVTLNFLRKLFRQRNLIWNFVIRDLRSRYVGSLIGFLWSVVHPLVLLVSYTFVFSIIFKVKTPARMPDNFAIFLFCGILPWLYFQDTLLRSSTSVIDHGNLIRKTVFPSEILPVALVLSNLVTHLVGFAILLVVLVFMNTLSWAALLLPLYLLLLAVFSLGLGWLAAALQVFLRDTAQVISVLMVLWFWFTPIFYQIEDVPAVLQPLVRMNPLSYVVQGYRDLLLMGRLPDVHSVLVLSGFSLGAFVLGGFVFRSTKREFPDVL
ncbi:MAG: ABC transporter permease [Acidobacteriota bacterium]